MGHPLAYGIKFFPEEVRPNIAHPYTGNVSRIKVRCEEVLRVVASSQFEGHSGQHNGLDIEKLQVVIETNRVMRGGVGGRRGLCNNGSVFATASLFETL